MCWHNNSVNTHWNFCYFMIVSLIFLNDSQLKETIFYGDFFNWKHNTNLNYLSKEHWSGLPFPSPVHESER